MDLVATLPHGLQWDAQRQRLRVTTAELADQVLRDLHIITGVDHGRDQASTASPGSDDVPSVTHFFQLWYTVGDSYTEFNTELRKAFTTRTVGSFRDGFEQLAYQHVAAMPNRGDLAREYLTPYFMNSTFWMIGVPEEHWPSLAKVAKLVIHLFKQQLRGVREHSQRELGAFEMAMRYLKSLTDRLLASKKETPFLAAARRLACLSDSSWPITALIGQLLMAGIEPMIVGTAVTCRRVWHDDDLLARLRTERVDPAQLVEEAMRQAPPFANIFRFVQQSCDCLGVPLRPGTVLAIDIASVNMAGHPPIERLTGCPVKLSSVMTFGKGTHYCLGANSARLQVTAAVRQLAAEYPELHIDESGLRVDTHNNLKQVLAMPYLAARIDHPQGGTTA
jgi:cytochrome P450 family 130